MVAVSVFLLNLLLALLMIFSFMEPLMLIPFLVSLVIKTVIDYRLLSRGAEFLGFNLNIPLLLIFELVYIPYVVATAMISILFSYSWKGRSGVK